MRIGASPRPATGGSRCARGEFVALLDSDDTWAPWKLELQLACLRQRPEVGMVWTDMDAVGPGGEVNSRSYLRTMYHAYRWFSRDELFPQSFPLAEIAPGLAPVVEDRRLYTGEIFSQMIMGNLVHTSTVLIRRERLDKVRGFNEELRLSGEDYDFHLRTCREGPVGFIDLSTIRYQTALPDRLTHSAYRVHAATNCLRTVLPWIERERSQINLPDRMLRLRLADMHGWLGDALLSAGEASQARAHLCKSLRHQLCQPRAWKALALASLPGGIRQRLRRLVRETQGQAWGTEGRGHHGRQGRMKRSISRVGANPRRLVPPSIPMIQEKNKAMGIASCSQAQTGSASGCEARLITTDSQLEELQTEWGALFDVAPTASPPLRWEWVREWWRIYGPVYGDRGRGLRIITVRRGPDLIGVLPLYQRSTSGPWGFRQLRFISTGAAEFEET